MSPIEKLADFIVSIRWESLPKAVQDQSRLCLMDNLSATLSGTLARVSQISGQYAALSRQAIYSGNGASTGDDASFQVETSTSYGGNDQSDLAQSPNEATVLQNGKQTTPAMAAFANASAANALDSDDGLRYAYGHAGAQVFPVALALCEARNLGGADLLTAMVVGYETAARIGRCWHDHHATYQACGSWGSVASAATAAHLMGLDRTQTLHALGISEYHAPNAPMMRDIDDPGMVKHAIGWGAMTGIMSAELASMGFTGIPSIGSFEKYREWMEDIGTKYHVLDGVGWKKRGYACCSWAHAAMEGARQLIDDHGITVDDIEKIRVHGFHETVRLGTTLPTTTEEAQFNLAWPVAAVIVDGEVGPNQMLEARLSDPEIISVAKKIELMESPEIDRLHQLLKVGDTRGKFAGRVEIVTVDGRVLDSGIVDAGITFPQPGWDWNVMEEKFRYLTGFVLNDEPIDELVTKIRQFENERNLKAFVTLCSKLTVSHSTPVRP